MTPELLSSRLDLAKSALEVGRDTIVLGLLVAVIVLPKPVGEHLARMGFSKVTTPIGDIDVTAMLDTTKSLATSISTSNQTIIALREQLATKRLTMPADKRGMVDSTIRMLDSTASRLGRADSSVTAVLLEQQTALAQAGIKAAPSAGWVRMESVLKRGDTVVVKGTLLLRGEGKGEQRWRAPVLGVLPAGTRVTVDSVEAGHGRDRETFVWVRVKSQ